MGELAAKLRALGLHPSHLPLGILHPGADQGCELCRTCNSFPCRVHAKSEADVICVRPAIARPNVTLWTNARARRLITDATGKMLETVEIERDGEVRHVRGSLFVVACGAVNSAALLLRSVDPRHLRGLANGSGLVGRRYMAHQATMISGRDPDRKNTTEFQKTLAINDFYLKGRTVPYPLGQIQSQGRTHPATLKSGSPWYARWVPEQAWGWWAANAVDWLAMSEDLPDVKNRVTLDGKGRIHLRYRQNNVRAHKALVAETKRILAQLGFSLRVQHSLGVKNTTHQCGTLVFGTDPARSVLDPFCRSHEVNNLFVVDASFFPSSGAVNPGLTIIAQALRTADHIKDVELKVEAGASA
jgi:choline dehydrogenase-like flavoprotein